MIVLRILYFWLCCWVCFFIIAACSESDNDEARLTAASLLAEPSTEGFSRATKIRQFQFPQDHSAHPDYRSEWWYITGNLVDEQNQKQAFGFQATFFRFALSAEDIQRPSLWRSNQLWMAHVAVTDIKEKQHYADERFSRGNPGMAGVQLSPFQIWLDDWQIKSVNNKFPWTLTVNAKEFAFNLTIMPEKKLILNGDKGLSKKSDAPGNASYYYSISRLTTQGTININKQTYSVKGLSWLDREWSTSSLDKDQTGWDWFSLQLQSGEDLMFYQLRTNTGGVHHSSQGTWVEKNSQTQMIKHADIKLTPLDWWQSEKGERYPIRWRMEYLSRQKDFIIQALVKNQKMELLIPYWEGAVVVLDHSGKKIGQGYLEMTGY
jgi:predicted secreted hydrolase